MSNLKRTLIHGLEHGIKFKYFDPYDHNSDRIGLVNEIDIIANCFCDETGSRYKFSSPTVKPLLFNLTDLTKEIDHKGERFVPLLKMWGERKGFDHKTSTFKIYDNKAEISYESNGSFKMIVNVNIDRIDQFYSWQINQLREWMFNVDNLSPDEFIEVTEEVNPYKHE